MEDIRYKKITKIVGVNSKNLLKVSLEIQTNHIKMKLNKLRPESIEEKILNFNQISWSKKLGMILKNTNIQDDEINLTEKDIRDMVLNYLKNNVIVEDKVESWKECPEVSVNIEKYHGPSIPLIKWLYNFSNEILDESIMKFVPDIVMDIKDIQYDDVETKTEYLDEYVLYMGAMDKYRGCIGLIEKTRNDAEAPTLVAFPGKSKTTNAPGRLWCNNDNLMDIN